MLNDAAADLLVDAVFSVFPVRRIVFQHYKADVVSAVPVMFRRKKNKNRFHCELLKTTKPEVLCSCAIFQQYSVSYK